MAILSFLKNSLKKIDFMTDTLYLRIEGSNSYKTYIGGFINLILVILSIIGIVYFGKELVLKNEPFVVRSSMDGHHVGPFKITNEVYNFFLSVEYSNFTYYQDDRVYNFKATYEVNEFSGDNKTQKYSIYPLEYDLCSKYYTKDELNATFDLATFFCVKPNTASIEGFLGSEKMGLIRVSLNKCVNTTENQNKCLPAEIINGYIHGGYLSMFISSAFMSFNDPVEPITLKFLDYFNSLNLDFSFDYIFETKVLNFLDDKGFLLQTITEKNFPYIDYPIVHYFGNRGNLICSVIIQGYRYGDRYLRSYTKIQDVVTKIGGLLKAFSIIASFIANLVLW